jgi:hypothetical protein
MDQKKIVLKYPITVNGKETAELAVSRLKTKHLKLLPKEFLKKIGGGKNKLTLEVMPDMIPLFAGILGIAEAEADEIDIEDLLQVADAIGDVLGN